MFNNTNEKKHRPIAQLCLVIVLIAVISISAVAFASGSGVVVEDKVNVRQIPNGKIVDNLQEGEMLTTFGKDNDWYHVITASNVSGFVHESLLYVVESWNIPASLLRVGSKGNKVVTLQNRLYELGYYPFYNASGSYDAMTSDAVRRYQNANSMKADGVAGTDTITLLFPRTDNTPAPTPKATAAPIPKATPIPAKATTKPTAAPTAKPPSNDDDDVEPTTVTPAPTAEPVTIVDSDTDFSYYNMSTSITLKPGDTGNNVKDLQMALTEKGFYTGTIDGSFGSGVKKAVKRFQSAINLDVDGLAGNYTLCALYSMLNPPAGQISAGRLDSHAEIPVAKIDWTTASKAIPRQSDIVVIDVRTGYTFNARRTGGSLHADIEPLKAIDTATIWAMYGTQWSWNRRPIWVIYNGQKYAASINGMPHGYDSISGNDMAGQLCIHFVDSRTHGGNAVCPIHQASIVEAYEAAPLKK